MELNYQTKCLPVNIMIEDIKPDDTLEVAKRFLDIEGMQETVINLLMPDILEQLKQHGIEPGHQQSTNGGYNNQNTGPIVDDPIPFPTQQPLPQPQPQQKLQMEQVLSLLQVLGPYLGPLLGLTPPQNNNSNGLVEGMKIYNEFDQIKRSGQNDILEIMATLTGSLTNRTDRDPAEVLGNLSKIQLDRNKNEGSN